MAFSIKKYIPILQWLPGYGKKELKGDLSAGLTVGVMLIPQGMAYAMLAGMPPIYGLYASILPLVLYAIFGTSRQLAVGPVAMVALLISSGVGGLAETGSETYIGYAILLALMVGVLQLVLGLFRLGFIVNFLSHPVISGFTSAAALIIGLSQLKHLLGVDIPRSHHIHEIIHNAFLQAGDIHLPTLLLGVVAIGVIILLKKTKTGIPGPLVAVVLGIGAVYLLGLAEGGMKIVGTVPDGLPQPGIPPLDMEAFQSLIPIALTISLVGFMESIAVAKAIQKKHKNYEVIPNQELIGLGIANIGGAIFQAFPTTGGFSRTAVNDQAGAKTGMASIISAALISLTLLFLTPLFYFLPKAILASVIMVAVFGLIDFKEAKHLWQTDKRDFIMLIVTFLATLTLGIEMGIGVGVVLSLVMVVYRSAYPHIAELARIPETRHYRNVDRFDDLKKREDVLVMRFDARLFFANAGFLRDKLAERAEDRGDALKLIVFDAGAMPSIDSTGVHALHDLVGEYRDREIKFMIAGAIGPVRDLMFKSGLTREIGAENFFLDVCDAVDAYDYRSAEPDPEDRKRFHREHALQHNVNTPKNP